MNFPYLRQVPRLLFAFAVFAGTHLIDAQSITHQITLPSGVTWCDDTMINGLLTDVNAFRAQNGVPALGMNTLGMEDAEMRAVQFAAYMAVNSPNTPGFDPHTGYDTTAAGLGYNLVSENLAYVTNDPYYIVYSLWQDSLHMAAMLSTDANVAGVSCVYSNGWPYWTFEPGFAQGSSTPPTSPPPTTPPPTNPSAGTPVLDSEESAFLTLINNYRSQNGVGPLQVSTTLQTASQWMSADLADNNIFSHTDSLGRSTQARLAAFGYTYSPWGENLAAGYSDAQDTFSQWETACDPDNFGNCTYAHRENMLNASYVAIGIARASNSSSNYGWYWTTDFGGYLDQALNPTSPTPTPTPAPIIKSFAAASTTIVSGQSTTLSWTVADATSVTINDGVGNVSNETSVTVSPSATTTYQLTASNGTQTTTASVTVAVTTGKDTQPPSAPKLVSAAAKSVTEVDLAWTASTDNVGVAGYQITRNGVVITHIPATPLSYADTSLTANTKYTYTVEAYDAAGNISPASNAIVVATPPLPTGSGTCPAALTNAFSGCYYNNVLLTGSPVLTRTDAQIDFNWTRTPPSAAVPLSNFSVRWQGTFTFTQSRWIFTVSGNGGMRLYIDGALSADIAPSGTVESEQDHELLTAGQHLITVEYYNSSGAAQAQVSWKVAGQ